MGEAIVDVATVADEKPAESVTDHADIMNLGDIEFAYCTEFFVVHVKKSTTLADIDRFREYLMTIGDSVIVIGDLEFVKVHVHTNNPDLALSKALKIGELDKLF